MDLTRRTLGLGLAATVTLGRSADAKGLDAAVARIAALEAGLGGRVGVAVHDTGSGATLRHRADARFPMCSTFKTLAAAAILAQVDAGRAALGDTLPYGPADLLDHAPAARAALAGQGGQAAALSLEALCAAAVSLSDNTAANLMLRRLGGPAALTAWLRGLGDATTRLDRTEPELNTARPGDPRDTTSPAAMAETLRACLLGPALQADSRARLEAWMVVARTGMRRLRAGVPPDWGVGDKTGTGAHGTANVAAILRPPGRAPLLAAVFVTGTAATPEACDAVHAEIGRLIAETP